MEDKNSFSLVVNEHELQDRSRRIARIHLEVMDFLKISEGDLIDICGDNNIMTTVCLSHPPTSDDKTVIRIGEEIRNHIGIQVGEKIVIRKHTESLINEEVNEKMKTISHPTLIISGSCINFEKELPRILNQLRSLQLEVHIEDDAIFRCYSDGEKTLGWDFFQISIESNNNQSSIGNPSRN